MTASPSLRRRRRGALLNRSRGAVFLGYHSVVDGGPPFLSIAPSQLDAHLVALRRAGYAAGTLEALRPLAEGDRPDRPRAFLTFDDGYVDNFREAMPLLREHGFSGLFFILPSRVDDGGPLDWDGVARERRAFPDVMRSMDWAMVEEMADAGMELGSHTVSHPRLPDLGDEQLAQELLDSRRRIAERLGRCDCLAYPFGKWDARVERAAAAAGYEFAFTLPFGAQTSASPLSIPRVTVDHRDDARRFQFKLSPAGRRLLLSGARTAGRRISALRRR